jgi:hypothetical protein
LRDRKSEFEIPALDLLLEVFLKGDSKKYNPNATYDFLASVFARRFGGSVRCREEESAAGGELRFTTSRYE